MDSKIRPLAPNATMLRLPSYLRYLKEKRAEGQDYISTVSIAEHMNINPMVVKKDIAFAASCSGKPKVGFNVETLISDIEAFLGYDEPIDAVLVGTGKLGSTLISYEGFSNYGLNIIAAFDSKVNEESESGGGVKILPIQRLKGFIQENGILLGIITVPKSAAQSVCDQLIESGVKAVWNFAPTFLKAPEGIAVKNEDMAASLAVLSEKLKHILKD